MTEQLPRVPEEPLQWESEHVTATEHELSANHFPAGGWEQVKYTDNEGVSTRQSDGSLAQPESRFVDAGNGRMIKVTDVDVSRTVMNRKTGEWEKGAVTKLTGERAKRAREIIGKRAGEAALAGTDISLNADQVTRQGMGFKKSLAETRGDDSYLKAS